VKQVETKLRELTRVIRALRELADELAVLVLAWAGLASLIVWLWLRWPWAAAQRPTDIDALEPYQADIRHPRRSCRHTSLETWTRPAGNSV